MPTIEAFRFGQEVEFTYVPGKAFLAYTSRSWILADDGTLLNRLPRRPVTGARSHSEVEVLLPIPPGSSRSTWAGSNQPRSSSATRGVLKTETAKDYRAGHRLYGLVNGRLMWVYEMAAMGYSCSRTCPRRCSAWPEPIRCAPRLG